VEVNKLDVNVSEMDVRIAMTTEMRQKEPRTRRRNICLPSRAGYSGNRRYDIKRIAVKSKSRTLRTFLRVPPHGGPKDRSGIRSQLVNQSCAQSHRNRGPHGESLDSVRGAMNARTGGGDADLAEAMIESPRTREGLR